MTNKNDAEEPVIIDSDDSADPQRNLIPPSSKELAAIIGAEANYDRWSNFVFPHAKSRDLYERRKHEWKVSMPDGGVSDARIEVIPAKDERCYTSRSYDVFLALIVLWKEQGMHDDKMRLHLSEIARQLDLKASGYNLKMILNELSCLYFTTISWVFSFNTPDIKQETLENQRVLDTFQYVKRQDRRKGGRDYSKCEVRFSEHIRENLRNNVTIPVNFSARKSISSDVAKTIYSRVDNILVTHKVYKRKALNIVHEYNLTPGRYEYKSQRKKLLELIQRNLDGVETSREGLYLSVTIEETADGKDWNCIFSTRGTQKRKTLKSKIDLPIINKDKEMREGLVAAIIEVVGGKKENQALYNVYALYYSDTLIFRALGEYKELLIANPKIKNKLGYFTALMHTIAHKMNKEWIKNCGKNCQYRPENQLFPNT